MSTEGVIRPAATRSGRPDRVRILGSLTLVHTINDFYGLILPPLLPALRDTFGLSYTQMGIIPFVSTGVSSLAQPLLGYLADRRLARRRFLVAGFVGYALAMVWLSLAGGYASVVLAAALLGLAASTYHPQSATYLVYYFRENRGFAQGIHGLGNGFGFMLAPIAVAFLVQQLGWSVATRYLAVPALVAAAVVLLVLREPAIQGGRGLLAGITRPLLTLTIVNGLALAAATGFLTWLPSYYTAQGYPLEQAGLLTAAMSAAGLIAQPSGGALSDRYGRRSVVLLSLLGLGLFQILFVAADVLPLMVLFSVAAGFCASLMPPVAMVYASELAAGQRTGTAVGLVWGTGTSISSFAPLLSGMAIDAYGFGFAFVAVSAVAFVAVVLASRLPG